MKLKDITCKNAKPNPDPSKGSLKLSDGEGLFLCVMPNGGKYWRYYYRYNNKQKTLALGVYPQVSLMEAREKRAIARKTLIDNKDPALEKKKEKSLSLASNTSTFEAVAREWHEARKIRWSERYAAETMVRLENDIFPSIGPYPIKEIDPPLLLQVIRKIEARGANELARRLLQKCGEIFRYGIACGKVIRDPSADIRDALNPIVTSHFASLDIKELPDFIRAIELNDARLYQSTRNALRLMMLTFVRTGELIGARWEEIDLERKEWVIPAARMKMKKEHIVPLSRQAISILQEQKELAGHWPLVFPSNIKPRKSMSNNTILGAIKRMGYQGRMTGHGFRALAMSTIKQELGYRHEVVDRQLAHTPRNKIDKAYDRALFLKERTKMMQEWADYLDAITNEGKVVIFERKKA